MAPCHGVDALEEPDTGHRSLKIVGAKIILNGGEQMKITVTKIVFLALTLILIPSTTAAKGPDGQTAAEETVCDGYTGQEYGLCNAYCEALDCESENPKASENACMKLLDKFMGLTVGILPPCYVPVTAAACPCFDRLIDEGFTDGTDCSGANDGLLKDTSNGSFLTVQAVAGSSNACIGTDGQIQMIKLDEANTCVNMIQDFCLPPVP